MKSLKFLTLVMMLLLCYAPFAQDQHGAIQLTVTEQTNDMPIPFANVALLQNDTLISGASTDFDGVCVFKPIPSGEYNIEITSIGFNSLKIKGVAVKTNVTTFIPESTSKLSPAAVLLEEFQVVEYTKPLIEMDGAATMEIVTSDEISRIAARNPAQLAATVGGSYAKDNGRTDINIRGARSDANYYYIDGIKVRGSSSIPQAAIEQVRIITGGLPARYENCQAGILHIPSQRLAGKGVFGKRKQPKPSMKQEPLKTHAFNLLMEGYEEYAENNYKSVVQDPFSTFSIDVDNASYTNARRIINSGYLPPLASVRIEEFVNYFEYERVEEKSDQPFEVDAELGVCPWNTDHQLLRLVLQADEIEMAEVPASNLVFLLDVSGSMSDANKLPLVKRAFKLLADQMRKEDKVSIVVYAGSTGIVLDGVSGEKHEKIVRAIDRLHSGGGTAGAKGIELAYKPAEKHFIKKGNNRVILATDGDFNIGISDDDQLKKLIEKKRESGVFLTTLGFGEGNYKDAKMEKLADYGNGTYYYIDSYREARNVFLKGLTGTILTVAKDVKFQFEFNPAKVANYRLLGYENRMLANEDFDNDMKDAGELGAGQSVVAFYEIVPVGEAEPAFETQTSRYRKPVQLNSDNSDELLFVKVRYKEPDADTSILVDLPINEEMSLTPSDAFVFGSAVVEFGLILRDSKYQGESSFVSIVNRAKSAYSFDPEGHRREFVSLVEMCDEMYAVAL